ncbi:MAG: MBL fold metallo-hydrolase [Chloroflexota bacterium]
MQKRTNMVHLSIAVILLLLIATGCISPVEPTAMDASEMPTETTTETTTEESSDAADSEEAAGDMGDGMMRETGAMVSVQELGDVVVHSYLAPEQVFANNTHIFELPNSLVLIDTQFLLPMAMDFRAYADSLGKPIERVIITHEHPDHFLGSEAFADLDIYALAEVAAAIEAIGQAEIDEKQADFGDAIASTFVVPMVLEPGTMEIDGVTFEFEMVKDAEAEFQVVTKLPDYGVVSVGDIVYSGVHLILAGAPPTWTEALENLKAEGDVYPIVLPGHGATTDPSIYDTNIAWLAKASELMGTATSAEEFKAGLVDAFPDLGLRGAIDFVTPMLFPADDAGAESDGGATVNLTIKNTIQGAFTDDAEAPYGNDTTMPLTTDQAVIFDDEVTGFVYDIEVADGVISMSWVSNENNDKLARVIEAGTFDRYYIEVDAPIIMDASANPDATLVPNVTVESPTLVIVEVGEGMEVGPGFDAQINIVTDSSDAGGTESNEEASTRGLIEVITVSLADGASVEDFLPTNDVIREEYASLQPGYLARETAVSEEGQVRLAVYWESKADSDNSIAGFGEAPGLEAFMGTLNAETMVIKQYALRGGSDQVEFPGTGAIEMITMSLNDGADVDGFLAANDAIREEYVVQQPGFIARQTGVTEDGEWAIIVHWESAADSAASIAKFESAPGVENFMSFIDMESMGITVYETP